MFVFLPGESRLAALQALGGSSALYFLGFAVAPFEKQVTFSAFYLASFFISFYSNNSLAVFLCPLFLVFHLFHWLTLDLMFILLFCSLQVAFQDLELKEMSLALFSQLAFLCAFINPYSKKNGVLFVLLFGLGGLQALTQSPQESWFETFFLFPMQGAGVLFFLFSSTSLREHVTFFICYLLNGFLLLIYFKKNTQLALAFLYFFLFLHFIVCACIFVRLKRKKLPMSAFPKNWKNFILKVKLELVPVLYIGVTFYLNSFYPATNKWISGVNSLVVQILLLLIYKKIFEYWGEKE